MNDFEPVGILCVVIAIIFEAVFAFIPAKIAAAKGYSFKTFYILGLFAFWVVLIVALTLPPKTDYQSPQVSSTITIYPPLSRPKPQPKQCQYCAALNEPEARKCQSCGAPLT